MSGKLIFDNYKQALTIICQDGADLEVLSMTLGTTAKDYEQDIINKRTYLQALKLEPAEVSLQLDYLELLQDLDEARYVYIRETLRYTADSNVVAVQVWPVWLSRT